MVSPMSDLNQHEFYQSINLDTMVSKVENEAFMQFLRRFYLYVLPEDIDFRGEI